MNRIPGSCRKLTVDSCAITGIPREKAHIKITKMYFKETLFGNKPARPAMNSAAAVIMKMPA
jgi:hypothetical protein